MPDRNRGQQPNDAKLFAPKWHPIFTEAIDDLCFLQSRGYADNSALQIVGNRYKLNKRQRNAILRVSSSNSDIKIRTDRACIKESLENQIVDIDGFNLLIFLESFLSGAYVFKCRDHTYRDISSVHGSYKRVMKTEEAIYLVLNSLRDLKVQSVHWWLDQPISNSGRLKTRLLEIAAAEKVNWDVNLVMDPDKVLAQSQQIIISSDGGILNQVDQWFNLSAYIIEETSPALNRQYILEL